MKISSILFLFTLFLFVLTFPSCQKQTPKVGILLHSYENERWAKDKNYLMENLTQQGAEVLFEVADNDQNKQIAQASEMI